MYPLSHIPPSYSLDNRHNFAFAFSFKKCSESFIEKNQSVFQCHRLDVISRALKHFHLHPIEIVCRFIRLVGTSKHSIFQFIHKELGGKEYFISTKIVTPEFFICFQLPFACQRIRKIISAKHRHYFVLRSDMSSPVSTQSYVVGVGRASEVSELEAELGAPVQINQCPAMPNTFDAKMFVSPYSPPAIILPSEIHDRHFHPQPPFYSSMPYLPHASHHQHHYTAPPPIIPQQYSHIPETGRTSIGYSHQAPPSFQAQAQAQSQSARVPGASTVPSLIQHHPMHSELRQPAFGDDMFTLPEYLLPSSSSSSSALPSSPKLNLLPRTLSTSSASSSSRSLPGMGDQHHESPIHAVPSSSSSSSLGPERFSSRSSSEASIGHFDPTKVSSSSSSSSSHQLFVYDGF
ncbi:hypothetical protein ADUPG1_006654 [Aduncisulcus paluster]|uniref:Uncharacterized protein n=1 Tax=Aduncisulcus paluster TaxID=2918883 RepID=A0ABQ5KM12_9EUKA|nr:hypothetical protein ADUPG1_006654 [Aduncisulcus paluster]